MTRFSSPTEFMDFVQDRARSLGVPVEVTYVVAERRIVARSYPSKHRVCVTCLSILDLEDTGEAPVPDRGIFLVDLCAECIEQYSTPTTKKEGAV